MVQAELHTWNVVIRHTRYRDLAKSIWGVHWLLQTVIQPGLHHLAMDQLLRILGSTSIAQLLCMQQGSSGQVLDQPPGPEADFVLLATLCRTEGLPFGLLPAKCWSHARIDPRRAVRRHCDEGRLCMTHLWC